MVISSFLFSVPRKFVVLGHRSGSTVDKWMVEFTSSSVNPVKLVYQLTATNIISAQPHPEDEKGMLDKRNGPSAVSLP